MPRIGDYACGEPFADAGSAFLCRCSRASDRLRHRTSHDANPWRDSSGRESADSWRHGRSGNLLRSAGRCSGGRSNRLRECGVEAAPAQRNRGCPCNRHVQGGLFEMGAREIWQATLWRRRRRGCSCNYIGGNSWVPSLKVLRHGGRLLVCGATAGYTPAEDLRYIWSFELQIIGSDGWTYEDQAALMEMVVEGKLKPVIHSTRPLSETPQALQELIDRKVFGKSILTISD